MTDKTSIGHEDYNNGSPWGSGGSGGSKGNSPWGTQKPTRPTRPGRAQPSPDDIQKKVNELKNRFGGGRGGNGGNRRGGGGGGPDVKGIPLPALLLGGLALFLVATSIFTVDQQEEAVVLRFGEYKRTVGPGLNFKLPTPIETTEIRRTREVQKIDIGGSSQNSLMLTGDENIVDIDFTVLWRINNLDNFLFEVADTEDAVRAVAQSAMREVVGKNPLDFIITTGRLEITTATRDLMQSTLDEYGAGVEIVEVQLQKADPPSQGGVVEAFRDVVNAEQDAETLVNQATAYKNDIVPKARGEAAQILQDAEGYAGRVVATAKGEAERFNLVYEEYRRAPRVTRERLYLETLEELYQRGQIIVMDEGGTGAVPYLSLNELQRNRAQGNQ